jgi:PTS system nitrogen regulatory IIA component
VIAKYTFRQVQESFMKLSDFVVRQAILTDLKSATKEDAIRAMVESLATAGSVKAADQEGIIAAILKREELGSTGIGKGVAVPHTKHSSVDKLVATVAISRTGVEFASLDGDQVQILFLLVSPPDRPGDHLRALENISRHLRNDNFCNFLKQATTAQSVIDLLEEADNNQLG